MTFFSRKKKSSPSNSVPASDNDLGSQQLPSQRLSLPPEVLRQLQSLSLQQQPHPQSVNPWSEHRLNLLPPTLLSESISPFRVGPSPPPFPRCGHALPAIASAAGELFLFGGLAHKSARNDLYVFSTRDFSATLLQTKGDIPSPRFGHASAHISTLLVIWGGATSTGDQGMPSGPYDDSLYLLNLVSRVWTRVIVNGPRPVGRYGHAMTVVGSKLFIFGGQVDGKHLDDMWAVDLNSLNSKPVWDLYEPTPGDERPPPRTGHVLVSTRDLIIMFGGSDTRHRRNDTWSFDVSTRKWTELQCTGSIPPPRHSHAAALVDDVMYVFGGRGADKADLGDLTAFKLSTQQWFTVQDMRPSPSGRWGHAMASDGERVFVLGGISSAIARRNETDLIHVLDTMHIEYPNTDHSVAEQTSQLTQESSAGPSTQKQPQNSTSSSSDAYVAHGASPVPKTTLEESSRPTSSQIIRDRNSNLNGLPSQSTGVNGRPEKGDGGEGSAEFPAKIAAPGASSEREVALLDRERRMELEGQMTAILATQTERDWRLAQLTEELALKSARLEQAEANATKAKERAELELREHADRLLAQTSMVEQKDGELVKMQARLDELVLSRDQAQSALLTATSRAADIDEGSQRASVQIRQYETELSEARAELKVGRSELEVVRLRLKDAEIGWAKSKTEADTLRALTTVGLVSTDEDRMKRGLLERIRTMEEEMASLRWSEKHLESMETRNEG